MQTATTPIGHNQPPKDSEILQARLSEAHAGLISAADALRRDVDKLPPEITDDASAGAFSDIIKQINGTKKNLESARVAEKEPFLAQGRAVDGFFKFSIDKLDGALRVARAPLDTWLRKKEQEERRRRDEEARRVRDEQEAQRKAALLLQQAGMKEAAAAMVDQSAVTGIHAVKAEAAAAVKPAQISATRSTSGALAQLKSRWVGEIIDIKAIDLEKLRHHLNPDHLQVALNSFVRAGGRELAGAKIQEVTETVIR